MRVFGWPEGIGRRRLRLRLVVPESLTVHIASLPGGDQYAGRVSESRGSRGRAAPGGRRPARSEQDRRRRELSQNFLRSDGAAAAQFLRQVDGDPAGLCLEVGAGEGILTERLAAMFGQLIAYEVDPATA